MITELVDPLEDTNQTLQNVKQDGDSPSLCSVLLDISTEIAHNTQQNHRTASRPSSIQAASVHSMDGTHYRLSDRAGERYAREALSNVNSNKAMTKIARVIRHTGANDNGGERYVTQRHPDGASSWQHRLIYVTGKHNYVQLQIQEIST